MFLNRDLTLTLLRFAKFPVVVILGPRQSGKTTLAKHTFSQHTYINLEDPEIRSFAINDPKLFLREYENKHGIIIDEFQYAPELLSYLQIESDEKDRPGYFVLTGSHNFLMNQAITQSLAGRAGIMQLLPLSMSELIQGDLLSTVENFILKGGYPRIYSKNFLPEELFPSYIRTYIERDVRLLINIENLATFQKFIKLCAGRIGQLLNVTDIATNCGISTKTADKWLSILESSYIVFLLKPHFNNFSKRLTKSPKLYFYDTGLACSFLGLRSTEELITSPFRGHLFENAIIADFYKQYYNQGLEAPIYFWRDQNGRIEIDCILDSGNQLTPIEIKSGETIVNDFFKGITNWNELAHADPAHSYIIYMGNNTQKRSTGNVLPWKLAAHLVEKITNND